MIVIIVSGLRCIDLLKIDRFDNWSEASAFTLNSFISKQFRAEILFIAKLDHYTTISC